MQHAKWQSYHRSTAGFHLSHEESEWSWQVKWGMEEDDDEEDLVLKWNAKTPVILVYIYSFC